MVRLDPAKPDPGTFIAIAKGSVEGQLLTACSANDLDLCRSLLEKVDLLSPVTPELPEFELGRALLYFASSAGRHELVRLLLGAGANRWCPQIPFHFP